MPHNKRLALASTHLAALAALELGAAAYGQSQAPVSAPAAVSSPFSTATADDNALIATDSEDRWRFRLTPYFLLGAMDGAVTAKGQTGSVDQDLGEVVDLLEEHLNFGACLHFEAEKGRWGLLADASYMDLRAEHESPGVDDGLKVQLDQFIGEIGGFYTLVPAASDPDRFSWRADALAGARLTWLELEVDPIGAGPASDHKNWIDPFVGGRVDVGLTEWLNAKLRADVGGFGIGSGVSSQLAWQVDAALSFRLSESVDLDAGYRWLNQDYEDGSGPDRFEYDMLISGPYMSVTFKF